MLSSKSIARARQAERKQQELAELVRLYDAAETYDEFQANRDIQGLHASNRILGFIDPFKLIYFLENHPNFTFTKAACWTSGSLVVSLAVLLAVVPSQEVAQLFILATLVINLLLFILPDILFFLPLHRISRLSTTIHSPNIP